MTRNLSFATGKLNRFWVGADALAVDLRGRVGHLLVAQKRLAADFSAEMVAYEARSGEYRVH